MVGVHTGGVWVAERLHRALALDEPLGTLNINFYRDDFTRIGLHPRVLPSDLPVAIDGRHVVLIDDVLQTGRSIRAALQALLDFGRPKTIRLGVLIDRGGRELPIAADFVGASIDAPDGKRIQVHLAETDGEEGVFIIRKY